MGRIAGDDPEYTFRLCRMKGGLATATKHGFTMPSVSTFIGEVMGKPAGAMSWWGFRIGLKGVASLLEDDPTAAIDNADPEALEALLKERGVNPNMKLDEAGDRGSAAHFILELLAAGVPSNVPASEEAAEVTFRMVAEAYAEDEERTFGTRYGWAVIEWWTAQVQPYFKSGVITEVLSEVPVWSVSRWYAGTFDLALKWIDDNPQTPIWEVLDLKTHKPASGFTKEGFGPGYISDITQIRAYRMAFEEMGFGKTHCQRIVIARDRAVRGQSWLEDTREVSERFVELIREAYAHKTEFEKGEA